MKLTIVQVAFPFAPVGPDAVGGAEQVLTLLDQELVRLGHRSIVVACAGSHTEGSLVATALPQGTLDAAGRSAVQAAHRRNLANVLRREPADVVHMHGLDFDATLPPPGVPTLVTLHLPPRWYPPAALSQRRPDTWFNAVSATQHAACPTDATLLGPVPNGVPVERLRTRVSKRGYALVLGRICPEKNQHAALDAGTHAGVPVLLGGQVFPYPDHERYWRDEVVPRLATGPHRFLGPLGFARKRRLLSAARCLISASIAPETSSLVAMEAMACGTPVVAIATGALPEIVEDGVTGILVHDAAALTAAIHDAGRLDGQRCRAVARERFSAEAMVARYLELYRRMMRRDGRDVAA